ncbi:hypothetical protein KIM67_00800 [Flagellimonas sp. 389]|uniref:DUF5700 domain-containing putative Zn-dependent protease n=1 Tax=Flagellimonas sp. 389 TaxID=2835862 RepID=UPI001BD66CBB|nr:DUF5700 domain-containing putative Zn-dependent protease [Flagellimonas sp. 389]MBS9460929.1 hypothetical protein [Flagellimonas sp. 389]
MKKIIFISFFCLSLNTPNGFAQKVETDITACTGMLTVLEQLQSDLPKQAIEKTLDSVLLTRPYKVMFEHYNRDWRPNHLPKEIFKRMILSLKFPSQYKLGDNQRADAMFPYWKNAFDNIETFKKNLSMLEEAALDEMIQEGVSNAQKWLPKSMKIPDFYFFVHPNGGSNAFAINGNQGYDFFQLKTDVNGNIDIQSLVDLIAHESHHLGLKVSAPEFKNPKDSLGYSFLQIFVAEGTASKFVDNMPGGFVDKISEGRSKNTDAEIMEIWRGYTLKESELFNAFEGDMKAIYDGTYSQKDVRERMLTFWLQGKKGRAYFLGAELFGAIYKAFGKRELFYVMEHPRFLLKYYNKAVRQLNERTDGKILLSDWLMEIL